MEYDDRVMCPLIDEKIDPMECVDVVDCVLNPLFLNSLPEKYKAKENFKDILTFRYMQTMQMALLLRRIQ